MFTLSSKQASPKLKWVTDYRSGYLPTNIKNISTTTGKGTNNFVIFDENLIEIVKPKKKFKIVK